jgi:hypothetical protein
VDHPSFIQEKYQTNSQDNLYTNEINGIQFKYYNDWKLTDKTIKLSSCDPSCLIVLESKNNDSTHISINSQTIQSFVHKCICKSLLDFVTTEYNDNLSTRNITSIRDNSTRIGNDIEAWQMEYVTPDKDKNYVIWFLNDDFFYEVTYYNNKDLYSKYLPAIKSIINTIQFFPTNTPVLEVQSNDKDRTSFKQPSFINPTLNQTSLPSSNTSNPTFEVMQNISVDEKDLPSKIFSTVIEYYPAVTLEFISNSTVVLKGDEAFMLKTDNDLRSLWKAIDAVKQLGFNVDEITESGLGSVGNPTRFYVVMSLNTDFKEKMNH